MSNGKCNGKCSSLPRSCTLQLDRPLQLALPRAAALLCSRAAPAEPQQHQTGHDCLMAGHMFSCSMAHAASAHPRCKHDMPKQPGATTG